MAGAAVVVLVALVFAAFWVLEGSNGPVDSTKKFFTAVKDQDTEAARAVICTQTPTLAEQFAKAIKGVESTLGTLDKVDVTAPETSSTANVQPPPGDPSQKREVVDFDMKFANGSVAGRATLVEEDAKWKVCFVDLQPPRTS